MKTASLASTILASYLCYTTQAQLIIPYLNRGKPQIPDAFNAEPNRQPANQRPMEANAAPVPPAPGFQLPPPSDIPPSNQPNKDGSKNDAIILSDILASHSSISIFASITNAVPSISTRLETALQNTTLLAPSNKAIQALPRKPWEDPKEYAVFGKSAYSGTIGEDRAQANMRRFAQAHVVPQSPWAEGEKVKTMEGGEVWWEKSEDGAKIIMPGNVKVEGVLGRVANGEVWVLEGVRNYASS